MINFFRNIRKQLTNENKFRNYFKYALGEVVIIMLGIFFALQLQNWNEKRQQEALFKVTLEQLYNTITDDSWHFDLMVNITEQMVYNLDLLLAYNDSIYDDRLPSGLWSITMTNLSQHNFETTQILQNLEYNLKNTKQNYLAKHLMGYGVLINEKTDRPLNMENAIDKALLENSFVLVRREKNDYEVFLLDASTAKNRCVARYKGKEKRRIKWKKQKDGCVIPYDFPQNGIIK